MYVCDVVCLMGSSTAASGCELCGREACRLADAYVDAMIRHRSQMMGDGSGLWMDVELVCGEAVSSCAGGVQDGVQLLDWVLHVCGQQAGCADAWSVRAARRRRIRGTLAPRCAAKRCAPCASK